MLAPYFFEDADGGGLKVYTGTSGKGGSRPGSRPKATPRRVTGTPIGPIGAATLGSERDDPATISQMVDVLYCGSTEKDPKSCGNFLQLSPFDQRRVLSKLWCYNNRMACAEWQQAQYDQVGLGLQILLAAAGLIPVVGEIADAAGAIIAAANGDWEGAALSAGAMIPGLGSAAGIARLGRLTDDLARLGRGCSSFSADTKVVMGDGTTKPIKDIKVGDTVLTTDPENGQTISKQVTHTWVHDDTLLSLRLSDGTTLTTTEDHPFWNATDGEWQQAQQLDQGDRLFTPTGATIPITGLAWPTAHTDPAYNLTIADTHTYYVLAGDIPVLVHNTGCDEWADDFIAASGGEKVTLRPPGGARLFPEGSYINQPPGKAWFHHTVVVRDGKVSDQWNPNGISIPEYKAQWGDLPDEIDFGF